MRDGWRTVERLSVFRYDNSKDPMLRVLSSADAYVTTLAGTANSGGSRDGIGSDASFSGNQFESLRCASDPSGDVLYAVKTDGSLFIVHLQVKSKRQKTSYPIELKNTEITCNISFYFILDKM